MKVLFLAVLVFFNFYSYSIKNTNTLLLNQEPILLSTEHRSAPEDILSAPVLITLHTNSKGGSQAFLDFKDGEEVEITKGFTVPVIRDFTSHFFEVINIGETPFQLGYFCNSVEATVRLGQEGGAAKIGSFESVGMPLTKTSKMFYTISGSKEKISIFALFVGSKAPIIYVLNPLAVPVPSFYNKIPDLKIINSNRFKTILNSLGSTVSILNISQYKDSLKISIY